MGWNRDNYSYDWKKIRAIAEHYTDSYSPETSGKLDNWREMIEYKADFDRAFAALPKADQGRIARKITDGDAYQIRNRTAQESYLIMRAIYQRMAQTLNGEPPV